jgi:C1A family cysteine protease
MARAKGLKRKYGWKPDVPDSRDFIFKRKKLRLFLPKLVDLRGSLSPVEDQGSCGSCTGNALAGNVEFLLRKNNDTTDVSRLFIYYNERLLENTVSQDAGAFLRDGIKTLAKHGVCAESLWPYMPKQYSHEPTAECYEDAKKRKIVLYERLLSVSDILSCLAEGYPVVCGIAIYESFESNLTTVTGMVNMPQPSEVMLGGHAVMICGYDLSDKIFIVRNSWGASWGVQGYFKMPLKYAEQLGDDFWTIRAMA